MQKRVFAFCLLALMLTLLVPGLQTLLLIPSQVTQFEGESNSLDFNLPWGVNINDSHGILQLADEVDQSIMLQANEAGDYYFTLNWMGLIPLKRMEVNIIPTLKVVPSGHSVGVRLSDSGVIVAGLDGIQTSSGYQQPAKDSGFEVGDIIVTVNGERINNLEHASALLSRESQSGEEIKFSVMRQGVEKDISVLPVLDQDSQQRRLGLLLRDTAAGIGTMTFYHPETGIYGALGHMITDEGGARPIDLGSGDIVEADVTSIQPGQQGMPGEKKGIFGSTSLGSILSNTNLGIYGRMQNMPEQQREPMPLGFKHEVKSGPAEILTVVEGGAVEKFDIEIEKVFIQNSPASKGMILRVTDPQLLQLTGGIVQGMSGSPIIQNGKFVGAVTHVFINEPQRGYGCFAEWMIMESGLLEEIESLSPPELWEAHFIFDKWAGIIYNDVELAISNNR